MGTMKLALEPEGPKRLELSWGLLWKDFRVTLDGKPLGTERFGHPELKKGVRFTLPDSSTLHLRLVSGMLKDSLEVMRNGRPVPGSSSDPAQRVRTTAHLLYVLAGLHAASGVIALVLGGPTLASLDRGAWAILLGTVIAMLGFFTYRGSRVALMLALVVYIINTAYDYGIASSAGRSPWLLLFIRIAIIRVMWQGVEAGEQLARERKRVTLQEE